MWSLPRDVVSNSLALVSSRMTARVYSNCIEDSAVCLPVVGFRSWIRKERSCCMNPLYPTCQVLSRKGGPPFLPGLKSRGILAGITVSLPDSGGETLRCWRGRGSGLASRVLESGQLRCWCCGNARGWRTTKTGHPMVRVPVSRSPQDCDLGGGQGSTAPSGERAVLRTCNSSISDRFPL